jgi:hypothetical protein
VPSLTRGRAIARSLVRVVQEPYPYITVSFETPPTWWARSSYVYPPGTGLYVRALGSLFVACYDTQGCGWDILTRFHTWKSLLNNVYIVRTSQEAHYVSATKTNRLKTFKGIKTLFIVRTVRSIQMHSVAIIQRSFMLNLSELGYYAEISNMTSIYTSPSRSFLAQWHTFAIVRKTFGNIPGNHLQIFLSVLSWLLQWLPRLLKRLCSWYNSLNFKRTCFSL